MPMKQSQADPSGSSRHLELPRHVLDARMQLLGDLPESHIVDPIIKPQRANLLDRRSGQNQV